MVSSGQFLRCRRSLGWRPAPVRTQRGAEPCRLVLLLMLPLIAAFRAELSAAEPAASQTADDSDHVASRPSLTTAGRFFDLFRAPRTDAAALSPDGRHLAYT